MQSTVRAEKTVSNMKIDFSLKERSICSIFRKFGRWPHRCFSHATFLEYTGTFSRKHSTFSTKDTSMVRARRLSTIWKNKMNTTIPGYIMSTTGISLTKTWQVHWLRIFILLQLRSLPWASVTIILLIQPRDCWELSFCTLVKLASTFSSSSS